MGCPVARDHPLERRQDSRLGPDVVELNESNGVQMQSSDQGSFDEIGTLDEQIRHQIHHLVDDRLPHCQLHGHPPTGLHATLVEMLVDDEEDDILLLRHSSLVDTPPVWNRALKRLRSAEFVEHVLHGIR